MCKYKYAHRIYIRVHTCAHVYIGMYMSRLDTCLDYYDAELSLQIHTRNELHVHTYIHAYIYTNTERVQSTQADRDYYEAELLLQIHTRNELHVHTYMYTHKHRTAAERSSWSWLLSIIFCMWVMWYSICDMTAMKWNSHSNVMCESNELHVRTYIHTYTHTYTHTYVRTHVHTYTHT